MDDYYLVCDVCDMQWSCNKEDYPELADEEHISCVCGTLICKKGDLK